MNQLSKTKTYLLLLCAVIGLIGFATVDFAQASPKALLPAPTEIPVDYAELVYTVSAETVTCYGMYEMECLLVREAETSGWTYLYEEIAGFEYQVGTEYVIRVAKIVIDYGEMIPADAPMYRYELIEVISANEVPPIENPQFVWAIPAFYSLEECESENPIHANADCLIITDLESGEMFSFFDSIIGFEYEQGYEYSIRVERSEIDYGGMIPPGASLHQYELIEVIAMEPVVEETPTPVESMVWIIAPEYGECMSFYAVDCLYVRLDGSAEWMDINHIYGLEYEEGFEYVVEVTKTLIDYGDAMPADAPMYRYDLVELISKEAVEVEVTPTPEPEESMVWHVGSEYIDCMSFYAVDCLNVRPDGSEEWIDINHIYEFEYEEGYEYTIRVTETLIDYGDIMPADAPMYRYDLVELIAMEAVEIEVTPTPELTDPLPVTPTPMPIEALKKGDGNCDNVVNLIDAVLIQRFNAVLIQATETCAGNTAIVIVSCDMNGDQACGLVDSLIILQCNALLDNPFCE